jgi:hypothetical protein
MKYVCQTKKGMVVVQVVWVVHHQEDGYKNAGTTRLCSMKVIKLY